MLKSENSPRKQEKGAVVAIYIYTTNPSFHIDVAGKPLLWYNYTEIIISVNVLLCFIPPYILYFPVQIHLMSCDCIELFTFCVICYCYFY